MKGVEDQGFRRFIPRCTDKKEKKILIYKEIQREAVAKSYMTNDGLLI
jgi:hypothetical protein